jgi:hypothetical protein
MNAEKLLIVNRQRTISLVEWKLKTVVLAGTHTKYTKDCTDTQTIRNEWINWTEIKKFYQETLQVECIDGFVHHFAPIRLEVNAESIAAFKNIAKETGWS